MSALRVKDREFVTDTLLMVMVKPTVWEAIEAPKALVRHTSSVEDED